LALPIAVDEEIDLKIILKNMLCLRDYFDTSSGSERVSLQDAQVFLQSPFNYELYSQDTCRLRDAVAEGVEEAISAFKERLVLKLLNSSDLE
jgi:hypothetical protein